MSTRTRQGATDALDKPGRSVTWFKRAAASAEVRSDRGLCPIALGSRLASFLVDMQQRNMSPVPASWPCRDADLALANCHAALAHARSKGFPVAFLRQFSRSAYFQSRDIIQRMDKRIRTNGR